MDKLPTLSSKERVILDLLVSNGEMYGLEMVKASKELKRGTIYVTLGRMEGKGLVESHLLEPQGGSGPPRRAYRPTGLGEALFGALSSVGSLLREEFA